MVCCVFDQAGNGLILHDHPCARLSSSVGGVVTKTDELVTVDEVGTKRDKLETLDESMLTVGGRGTESDEILTVGREGIENDALLACVIVSHNCWSKGEPQL